MAIPTTTSLVVRRTIPALLARFRALWKSLTPLQKTAVLVAADAGTHASIGALSDDEKDAKMAEAVSTLNNKSDSDVLNTATAMLAAVPEATSEQLLAETRSSLRVAEDTQLLNQVAEVARARRSSTLATGDGEGRADAAAAGYKAVVARAALIRRALSVLGTTNPQAIRALRDVMFMDEEEFNFALSTLE